MMNSRHLQEKHLPFKAPFQSYMVDIFCSVYSVGQMKTSTNGGLKDISNTQYIP